MYLIVALGNPGKKYKYTRHNAGFMAADLLAKKLSASFKRREKYFWAKTDIHGNSAVIAKPRNFVNLSGEAVKKMKKDFEAENEKTVLVHDDADLPLGTLKVKKNGSSGGHNGVQSVIDSLGTQDFPRIRLGVGRDNGGLKSYVLGEFSSSEKKIIEKTINRTVDAIFTLVEKGIDETMLEFNRGILKTGD